MSYVNVENLPKDFLQGAVYCWCKNRKNEPFTVGALLGGDNFYWQGTPLIVLYEYYLETSDGNDDYAKEEAGKAAGRLMYDLLYNDKREFRTWKGFTRNYEWTGNEDND